MIRRKEEKKSIDDGGEDWYLWGITSQRKDIMSYFFSNLIWVLLSIHVSRSLIIIQFNLCLTWSVDTTLRSQF